MWSTLAPTIHKRDWAICADFRSCLSFASFNAFPLADPFRALLSSASTFYPRRKAFEVLFSSLISYPFVNALANSS
jgi:hypothetical protein